MREVDGLVTYEVELELAVTKAILTQKREAAMYCCMRWLIVVEEVSSKQHKVNLHVEKIYKHRITKNTSRPVSSHGKRLKRAMGISLVICF